jgi:hypothetical protein
MTLLSHPLIRYVTEVMFIISLTAFVVGIIVSSWSFLARHFPGGDSRWKRPEELGLGCWKVPK